MKYHFQEGSIELPCADYQDSSIHILKFPSRNAGLSVTRDVLAEGQTAEQYLAGQIAVIRKGIRLYTVTEPAAFTTDGGLTGYSFYCEPEQNGQHLYQYVAGYDTGGAILVITYSLTKPFTDADLQDWQTVKQRFSTNV